MRKDNSLRNDLKKYSFKKFAVDNVYFLIGCLLYSLGVNIFAIPNNIAQSGMTGVAIIINYLFPQCPVGMTSFLLNVPLIILAWIFIGKFFTFKTLWVTAMLSMIIDGVTFTMSKGIIGPYHGDKLLASIFCGAMCGAGLALIIVRGATSGGTDILGRLFKKIWPHMSIGRMIMLCDAAVVIAAAIVFRSVDSVLYAAILIFVSSKIMDFILYGTGNGKMLYIFTKKKGKELAKAITEKGHRGATIIEGEGGYTGEVSELVICVARSHEIPHIKRMCKEIDPEAFIVMSEANEILGYGFNPPALDD